MERRFTFATEDSLLPTFPRKPSAGGLKLLSNGKFVPCKRVVSKLASVLIMTVYTNLRAEHLSSHQVELVLEII